MTLPTLLLAFATFRQKAQPEWFVHIHSQGHASARLARGFAGTFHKTSKAALEEIEFSAYMRDVGKYLIPKEILFKAGPLDGEEMRIMSLHPVYAVEVLGDLPFITPTVVQTVLHHHERWDGTGYPDGLVGMAIPFAARMVSVVETYTALRSRRPYRSSFTRSESCNLLRAMAGHELDPHLVRDFLSLIEGQVPMRIGRPTDPNEPADSSVIRETLRAVLQ